MSYVFSVVSYGCETWTYSKAIDHKINAFEMWCYRRMLRISWTSHTTTIDVLQKIGVKETTINGQFRGDGRTVRALVFGVYKICCITGSYLWVIQKDISHCS